MTSHCLEWFALVLLFSSCHCLEQCAQGDDSCASTAGLAMLQRQKIVAISKFEVDGGDRLGDEDEESDILGKFDGEEQSLSLADSGAVDKENGIVPGHAELEYVKYTGPQWTGWCCTGTREKAGKAASWSKDGIWKGAGADKCATFAGQKYSQGYRAFMIHGKTGDCFLVKETTCKPPSKHNGRCRGWTQGKGWHRWVGFSIFKAGYPRVDSIFPNAGAIAGGSVVTIMGANLMPGRHGKTDVQDFAPPATVCLQNTPCDIDYFSSDSDKIVCRARAFNSTPPKGETLEDADLQRSITLGDNLCQQIEKQVPGGHVFKKDELVDRGHGYCDRACSGHGFCNSVKLKYTKSSCSSKDACKKLMLQKGGKSFTWRINKYKNRQPCMIWKNYCEKPRTFKHSPKFPVMSLVPPTPAVYVKLHGEFVGGLVTQKWNAEGKCLGDHFGCSFAYDNQFAAEVLQVLPDIATPGEKIRIVGKFAKTDVTNGGKVWLLSDDAQDDPVFCRTMDEKAKLFKVTHAKDTSFFDCVLPMGLVPGNYSVKVFHDTIGESLPFKMLEVRAKVESVQQAGSEITLQGYHLKGVTGVHVGGVPCMTQSSNFHMLTCKLPEAAHWTQEHYGGGPGAVVQTVRLGADVESVPQSFADAEIMAAAMGIEPEVHFSSQMYPPRVVDAARSGEVFFSRTKALFQVDKSGLYLFWVRNHNKGGSDAILSVSGLKPGTGKYESATGQFQISAGAETGIDHNSSGWLQLDHDTLYSIQLENSHTDTTTIAGVEIGMQVPHTKDMKSASEMQKTFFLVRGHTSPQITGQQILCANVGGCQLPHHHTTPALLQEAATASAGRLQPPSPERANRVQQREMPLHELTSLRRSAPGLGAVPHSPSLLRSASLLQQQNASVVITTSSSSNGTCYWGPQTLYATLEGCVPGETTGKKGVEGGCNNYPNIDAAKKACGEYHACGGLKVHKDGTAQIRSGRWLQSDLQSEAVEKLGCGKWVTKATGAGGTSKTRACNLKDFQVEGEFGKSLEGCKKYCLQQSPRRASGFLSTRHVEYHNDTYCACFSNCENTRHPDKFASTADIYEFDSADIVTEEHVPNDQLYKNNKCLNKVCRFSDPEIWGTSGVPSANDTDIIYIPENVTLLLDQDVSIRYWVIEGTLIPERKKLHIQAEGIFVNGGTLRVGTADKPFKEQITFEMMGHWHSYRIPVFGSKVIGVTTGNLELYGDPVAQTWTELAETAHPDAKTLKVLGKDAALWAPNSRIVLAATDATEMDCDSDRKDSCQTEEAVVLRAEVDKDSDTTTLHLKDKLKYRHLVEEMLGSRGEDMNIRAEVGLLSRNIRVIGSQNDFNGKHLDGTQHFGAQVMMLKLDKVALEYVEFHHVGQAHSLGRYPVHFHHSGSLSGRAHVRGCAIHRTFNRAVTNHGTHNLLVENNVAYNVQGHCYFFEDAVETGAMYRNNIGFMIRQSMSLLQVDLTPAVFWVTNPQNNLIGNHAAGSHGFGFWFDIKSGPRGLSMGMEGYLPTSALLGTVVNNTAHSAGIRGLWVTNYDPQQDGKRVTAIFDRFKTWGNTEGYEALSVGHVWIRNHVSISDGEEAVTIAIAEADRWGTEKNGWSSPAMIDVTIKSKSALPSNLWTKCGIHGPTNDYVVVKGLHVHDSFKTGFFCGCKWCPGPAGGLETRFYQTTFGSHEARRMNGWRNSFDALVWDADGSLTGVDECHLHGCMVHSPIGKGKDAGLGHFPPEQCKLKDIGIVCNSNVALRTMRIRDAQPATTKFKPITITTPHGSSSTSFYFYDFRIQRQNGGLYHYTMVTGLNHNVQWEMGALDVDIDSFYGEICSVRKDEHFLWSTKTLANPVSFKFQGKPLSLDRMASIGCPAVCEKNNCLDRLDGTKCVTGTSSKYTECGGCRVTPNTHSNHRLVKVGVECKARDMPLGEHVSVDACADACTKRSGCKYFIFGHGSKRGRCYQEVTESEDCPEGWEPDMYDFYAVREKGDNSSALVGVDFANLSQQPLSNGLWQYTSAVESFDLDKWRPGLFTGLINAKVGKTKKGLYGDWDGTDEEHPLSTWGVTPMSPCTGVSFARTEGTVSACADEKDEDHFGLKIMPQTIKWCSEDGMEVSEHWKNETNQKIVKKTIWEKDDTTLIPATWKVHFNCKKPITVRTLEIHGQFIFDEGSDRHLTSTHIFISYLGVMQVGTKEAPFPNKVVIALDGHRRSPAWPAMELGSKFIASAGRLDLYGLSLPTWTRLAKAVTNGATDLELESDLKLNKGDQILITTTSLKADEIEKHVVSKVDGLKVTLTKPFAHSHDGLDSMLDGYVKTKGTMAAEVAVLRGNIIIEGLDTSGLEGKARSGEKWGAVIKVFTVSDKCDAKPSIFHMQGVDMQYCGRDTTHCIEVGEGDPGNFVKNSVVRHGLGNGFMGGFGGIKSTEKVLVTGNLVYNFPKGHGIQGSGKITHNLVTSCGYGYWKINGAQEFTDNVASGMSKYTMFKQQYAICLKITGVSPGKWRAVRNVVRSCGNGVIGAGDGKANGRCTRTLPSKSPYPKTTGCATIEGVTVIHINQMGFHSYGGTMLVNDFTFINANKAASHAGSGPSSASHSISKPDIRFEVTNSAFYSKKGRCRGFGVAAGSWYNAWLRIHRPLMPPSLYGGTVVEGSTFYGYGSCEPALVNDPGSWQVALHDGAHHTMFTAKLKFVGGSKDKIVKFYNSGHCLQLLCDGRRSSIMVDTDGTLLPDGKAGTIVARNEQSWKYGILPHTMRFDSKGKTIPNSTLYQDKGAYRKGCKLKEDWNAWECPGGQHRLLILESMDPDWLERRYAPVAIEVNDNNKPYGGNIAMYTGPGTGNTGMVQAFWTVAHLGMRHNIYFASTNPQRTRVHLRDADPTQGVVLCVYYGLPNRVEVFVGKKRAHALAEPTWDKPGLPTIDASLPIGANVYDRIGAGPDKRPGYLYVVAKGPQPIELTVSKKIKLTQKLEVGEQEFVYKKGSQGLVRNIALLLNIPESRIKVVGMGSMKDGEIWGKHNGVESYKPPSLLQAGEKAELMEVVIDPFEAENEDEIDVADHELKSVFKDTKYACKKGLQGELGGIHCNKDPEIDSIPVPGWKCGAEKYGGGDGCDCDCGIWDPDCDKGADWAYGVAEKEGEISLMDTSRVEALLKRFDVSPKNHELNSGEIMKIHQTLTAADPLRVLAQEIHDAGDHYVPLLKLAKDSSCPDKKKCLMNRKLPLTTKALPSGVCVTEPAAKVGTACDAKPCGKCSSSKCVSNSANSWGFQCVPTAKNVAIVSSSGKFLQLKLVCTGPRRRRKCVWQVVFAEKATGFASMPQRGLCDAEVLKKYPTVRKGGLTRCMELATQLGAKALTYKLRWKRSLGQPCILYKGYCKGVVPGNDVRWNTTNMWLSMVTKDSSQMFQAIEAEHGQVKLKQITGNVCLAMGSSGLTAGPCKDGKVRQLFDMSQDCTNPGMLKSRSQKKCVEIAKNETAKEVHSTVHECDKHYKNQQFSFVDLLATSQDSKEAKTKELEAPKKKEEDSLEAKTKELEDQKKRDEEAALKKKADLAARKKKEAAEAAKKKLEEAARVKKEAVPEKKQEELAVPKKKEELAAKKAKKGEDAVSPPDRESPPKKEEEADEEKEEEEEEGPSSEQAACVLTKNAAIHGYNTKRLRGKQTVESCTAACAENIWCKSFDFYKKRGWCDLSERSQASRGLRKNYRGHPYDYYDCQALRKQADQKLEAKKEAWSVNGEEKWCCTGRNCRMSVKAATLGLKGCQQQCKKNKSCIGFQFGNKRKDKWNRCYGTDGCACWLITKGCKNQKKHSGYNVYMKPKA